MDGDGAALGKSDPGAFQRLHGAELVETNRSCMLGDDEGLFEGRHSGTTHVESTHRQLCSWLTDRLGGDDADSFTDLRHTAGTKVQAVALRTATTLAFASENGADFQAFHTDLSKMVGFIFADQLTCRNDGRFVHRVVDGFAGNASVDASLEIDHFFVTLIDRGKREAVDGSAVFFEHDDVLRNIDQLTGHVTGVSRLQSGVSETLTSSVSRDEVLKHRKTFTEVRGNRALDDLTRRLGHQTAHTGELLDLGAVTTRTGGHHDVERVVMLLALVVFKSAEEFISNLVTDLGPFIDDLLVALTVGDDTATILLLEFFDVLIGLRKTSGLGRRNHHVRDTNRTTGTSCFAETEALQAVQCEDGLLVTSGLEAAPDNV